MACLYSHRRKQDPKARLFIDFMVARMTKSMGEIVL
jgi:DNA-binding transcriptional LysR family regulator